ncbi:hypothetical protein PIB30_039325 [Stylosanthes scabra]|uniref:RNase H type-1 domain-containing protein n=1 Tax=Stylosanthes scabra TaxID=79078 RepID=A0ABU6RED8_9FABA|nr:hypothetical protein [Stylosanthes scabra]
MEGKMQSNVPKTGLVVQNANNSEEKRRQRRATWRPPSKGWTKLNIDVAFSFASGSYATAAIFKDSDGRLLTASNSTGKCISPLTAEALAMQEALITAQNLDMEKVIVESDCSILVQAIKSKSTISEIDAILEDIHCVLRKIPDCGVV